MPRRRTIAVLLFLALSVVPQAGEAWGRQGHRIVARIAAKNLSPHTRLRVRSILGVTDGELEVAMASAATWPDAIDRKKTGTSNWHFVDAPVFTPFSVAGTCANHDCVIDRILEMEARLRSNQRGFRLIQPPDLPRTMVSQELAFLIHLVGDIHQPLHAATNGDRGGNCIALITPLAHADGTPPSDDLHAVWDSDTVLSLMSAHGGSESATATALFGGFKKGATVAPATPLEWARESNAIARTIYQSLGIPARSAPPGQCAAAIRAIALSPEYPAHNASVVELRLIQAGIRLSTVLDNICRGDGCKAQP